MQKEFNSLALFWQFQCVRCFKKRLLLENMSSRSKMINYFIYFNVLQQVGEVCVRWCFLISFLQIWLKSWILLQEKKSILISDILTTFFFTDTVIKMFKIFIFLQSNKHTSVVDIIMQVCILINKPNKIPRIIVD